VCLTWLIRHRRSDHREVNVSAHMLGVPFRPLAHTSKRDDERFSKSAQRILDSDGLLACDAPRDQSSGLEITKSSRQHALRYIYKAPAQFPVSMRSLFERKQNLGGPSADEDRGCRAFRSRYNLMLIAHDLNLRLDIETVGVTSVAGFRWTR
jgi:hypothetical protein